MSKIDKRGPRAVGDFTSVWCPPPRTHVPRPAPVLFQIGLLVAVCLALGIVARYLLHAPVMN